MKEFVTIQDSPKHKLLRAYDSDLGVQNPIGEADFHGFCIRNWSGTEQLRNTIRDRKMERDGGKDFLHFTPIFAILCIQKTQEVQYYG